MSFATRKQAENTALLLREGLEYVEAVNLDMFIYSERLEWAIHTDSYCVTPEEWHNICEKLSLAKYMSTHWIYKKGG